MTSDTGVTRTFAELAQQAISILGKNSEGLRSLFDLFPLGVLITDKQGRLIYYNQAHSKIDDLTPDEVLGRLEIEVLAPINGPNIMKVCQRTAEPILGYIFPYRTPKGRVVNAAYWIFPIQEGKEVKGAICFTQPLLGEMTQSRAHSHPPIQWPGSVPINMPQSKVVGGNQAFKKAVKIVKSNANNPFPLLIAGETGSGKEMLAKLTHKSSARRHGPYLALNCSAIPGTLLEGLLFGTVKGSFTGAIDRPGFFEEANGGSIYLDEVDSMSLELQPKLLRVIQEMKVSRVGSAQEIDLDLKIISSIGSSPQEALNSGALRPDLFYRLAVVMVNIPPLRERPEDLEELSEHFICRYNNILGKEALKIDPRLKELMRAYNWPGNVRELEHMLAGALALVQDENVIGLEHISDHYIQAFNKAFRAMRSGHAAAARPKAGTAAAWPEFSAEPEPPLEAAHDRNESMEGGVIRRLKQEEKYLRQCLAECQGNLTQAAKQMSISRQLLSYRLLKHGLDYRDYRKTRG